MSIATRPRQKRTRGRWLLAIAFTWLLNGAGLAQADENTSPPLRPQVACPTELETVVAGLLRDLPSYTNRVIQRSSGPFRQIQRPTTVLVTSQPEFEPIDLELWAYTFAPPTEEPIYQVFFTTLERQYIDLKAVELQHYHWLFLSRSRAESNDWQLAFMFSRQGDYPDWGRVLTPPIESTYGAVGRAVQLWLRDCRAQAVEPIPPPASPP
ncbi:hypothetical protein [Almyronema epifaneia]|uniref:Uncharacterized protein n=1 Tax=Almyronema epifaneia S1 TaxID=2991925 RepID=A0ABW6IF87_9CYAN